MWWMTLVDDKRANAAQVDDAKVADPAARTATELPDDDVKSEVSKALITVLPWGISTLIHTSLVLLSIWLVWVQVQSSQEEEIIIPSSVLSDKPGSPLGGSSTASKLSGGGGGGGRASIGGIRSIASSGIGGGGEGKGIGGKVGGKGGVIGVLGPGSGGGDGSGGKGSPFGGGIGPGSGEGVGFGSSLYGSGGGNARRIGYLIDASGSLIDTLPFVIMELKRSINELSEKQSFTVVFFQGDRAIEAPPAGLKQATPQTKKNVLQWIDPRSGNVTPKGRSNPIPALKQILAYKPQLLYILSDNITGAGQWETNQERLVAEVQVANVGGTKINTIQFLYDDPLAKLGKKRTLELVADKTGGIFKFVDARALGLE